MLLLLLLLVLMLGLVLSLLSFLLVALCWCCAPWSETTAAAVSLEQQPLLFPLILPLISIWLDRPRCMMYVCRDHQITAAVGFVCHAQYVLLLSLLLCAVMSRARCGKWSGRTLTSGSCWPRALKTGWSKFGWVMNVYVYSSSMGPPTQSTYYMGVMWERLRTLTVLWHFSYDLQRRLL